MAFARRFAINVTSNWVGVAVRILANIVLVPYLIHKLGDESYGIWELVGGFLAYIALLDVGLTMAIRRFAARYAALKNDEDQNRLMSTAVVVWLYALYSKEANRTFTNVIADDNLARTESR